MSGGLNLQMKVWKDIISEVIYIDDNLYSNRSYFTGNALLHPAYSELAKKYENPLEDFPVATKSTRDTFFMGVYPGITEEQMNYIGGCIDEFFSKI